MKIASRLTTCCQDTQENAESTLELEVYKIIKPCLCYSFASQKYIFYRQYRGKLELCSCRNYLISN